MRPEDAEVSAQIDEPVVDAGPAAQRRDPVGGVFLHVAAEVDFHAGRGKHQVRRRPAHTIPAHGIEGGGECGGIRESPRFEVPGAAQDAGADVEQAIALGKRGARVVEKRGGLGVDPHTRGIPRAAVDGRAEAVVPEARVFGFEPRHFCNGSARQARQVDTRSGIELELAGAPHRVKGNALERHVQNL